MKEMIQKKILSLKQQQNAVILAHYYQTPDVQDVADVVGDSLELARKAGETDADVIVLCGVYFMAESAKVLNPNKIALLPVLSAGCPMADMVSPQDVLALRKQHQGAAVVCYVNSSVAVKAESDICCTSSNAVKIVQSLPQKDIIFVPDQNLGAYVAAQLPEKNMILFNGYCHVHHHITIEDVQNAKQAHPNAQTLIHPECKPEVVALADFVGSTKQIIEYAKSSQDKAFIIGTEEGILHPLKKQCPDKEFYLMSPKFYCPNMKKIGILDVLYQLEHMTNVIEIEKDMQQHALQSLQRMIER